MDERENILFELKKVREEINPVKARFDELNRRKEVAFSRKESLKSQIGDLSLRLKVIKSQKDKENIGFVEAKNLISKSRDELNEMSSRFKSLVSQRNEIIKSRNLKGSPDLTKKKIEQLELSIETEGYTYDQEQKVMKQIKKLKAIYEDMKDVVGINNELDSLARSGGDLKDKMKVYGSVARSVKSGQYSEFIALAKTIQELRRKEEEAFGEFIKLKNEFNEVNARLKNKLNISRGIKNKLNEINRREFEERKKKERLILEEKARIVEDKLKTRKKLTTQDILAFQGGK